MEARKNPQVDLERYRGLFFSIGLIISLSFLIVVFEWKFYDDLVPVEIKDPYAAVEVEELDIPTTVHSPPPPPKTVLVQPDIVEVKNDEEIIEELEITLDAELQEDQAPMNTIIGSADGVLNYEAASLPQAPPPPEEEDEIFLVVEDQPEPYGGMTAFYEYIKNNLEYPKYAKRNGVTGKVFLQFIVDKEGRIGNIKVVKGIGYGCDEEAARVLANSPKWKPGKQRGRCVKVKMTIPIMFKFVSM